jgi:hypothetical protein
MSKPSLEYIMNNGVCQGIDHREEHRQVDGYFKIRKNKSYQTLCKTCTMKIPSLQFRAIREHNMLTKVYRIKGKYLRRKYGGNHFKLKSKEGLLEVLKTLRTRGYRVPLFGNHTRQISVSTLEEKTEGDQDEWFDLVIRLEYWEDLRSDKEGFNLIYV